MSLWIKNGRIIDPASDRDEVGDVFVKDGRIAETLTAEDIAESEVIDAKGLIVCPGLVDIHVHLREPGQKHKETIASGSRAAAAGGFTTIVCMPNTSPPVDNAATVRLIQDSVERTAVVNVFPTGCITLGMEGEKLAPIGSLHRAGIVAITDDGKCVQSNELMRRAVEYACMFGLPVLDHCQDYSMTRNSVINEGNMSLRLGLNGWPNAAEDIIVARNIILSRYTDAQIHMQHITSAFSVEILRRNKALGVKVTAEATPHHIFFTDADLKDYNPNFKMNPPLRTEADREALIEGLLEGTLDCLATDHAPHSDYEKDREIDYAPFGIIGLETALSASLVALYHSKRCELSTVIDLWTRRAARILGLPKGTLAPGADADITLFDPDEHWTVHEPFQSRSTNTPWLGHELRGIVKRTIVAGKTVWDGNQIHAPCS